MKTRVMLAIAVFLVVACGRSAGEDADPCETLLRPSIRDARERRKGGEYQEAEEINRRTLEAARSHGCRYHEALIWHNLGSVAMAEGRLTESLRLFREAKTVLSAWVPTTDKYQAKYRRLSAKLAYSFGAAYFRLGWLDDANDALQEARSRYRLFDASADDKAEVLLLAAQVHRLRGETQAAADAVEEALAQGLTKLEKPTLSSLLMEQARLALGDGRFEDAERSLDRADEALKDQLNPLNRANVISDRAELEMRRGRWAESLRQAKSALDLTREAEAPDLNLEAHARYLKSVALWKLGDPDRSRRAADAALALLEETRDAWQDLGREFLANRKDYYRHRLDLAAQTEGPEAAWAVFEGYRAQGLLEVASQRALRPAGASDPKAQQEIRGLREALLAAVRGLDALDPTAPAEIIKAHEARFHALRRILRSLQADQQQAAPGSPRPEIGLDAAAELLDSETLALVFATGAEKLYVLALTRPEGARLVRLDAEVGQIEDLVDELLQDLDPFKASPTQRQLDRHVRELSQTLLGPIAGRLDAFRRLVIVADGALERLPFGVLRHPETDSPLAVSHEIAYLPSFSVLAAARERACSAAKSGLFALGDPIFGSHDERWSGAQDTRSADEALLLRRLPASAAEVEGIARLYTDDAAVALGGEATRERFLAEAPGHRVLHVASHARSNRQAPERSKIALSCLDAEGRVLEACDLYFVDIASLDLCGQVVVLSACETAGGRPVAGEGILGLPWVFLRAGAGAVVASHWQVADELTAKLMIAFHRHLRAGAGPAAALRQAKLELIDAGSPPSDWAAFVVLGDWRLAPSLSTFSKPSGPME